MQIQIADFYNLKYLFTCLLWHLSISHTSFIYAPFKKKHRERGSARKMTFNDYLSRQTTFLKHSQQAKNVEGVVSGTPHLLTFQEHLWSLWWLLPPHNTVSDLFPLNTVEGSDCHTFCPQMADTSVSYHILSPLEVKAVLSSSLYLQLSATLGTLSAV